MSPQTFKHFRVLELLGKGGMGEVYLALDTTLERKVALKFLPRELLRDPSAQGRLLDEARSVSRVQHPNIAVVHSIEEDGGIYAICMEYVEGITLKQLIAKGTVGLNQIVRIGAETAAGMHAAHEKGIVHRDLKPANVMITRRGQVKIMDFGLALRPERVVNTMGPNTYGTVQYMSPEQARGETLTAASDIFSFGSTFYELVTGRPPFKASNDLAILNAIIHNEPEALREHRRDVPPALEQIVRGCLAKAADQRWDSMATIAEEFRFVEPTVEAGPRDLISELSTGLKDKPQPPHHRPDNLGRVGRRSTPTSTPPSAADPSSGARDLGIELPEGFVVHEVRDRSDAAFVGPRSGSRPRRSASRTGELPTVAPSASRPPSVLGPDLPASASGGPRREEGERLVVRSTREQWQSITDGRELPSGAFDVESRRILVAREAERRAQDSRSTSPSVSGPDASRDSRPPARPGPFRDLQDLSDQLLPVRARKRGARPRRNWPSIVVPLLVALVLVAAASYALLQRAGVQPPIRELLPRESVSRVDAAPGDAAPAEDAAMSPAVRPRPTADAVSSDSLSTRESAAATADSARTLIDRLLRRGG